MGILPGCCSGTFRLLSVAFLYGPTASWANGDTFCLCRPSCLRHVTGRKSPHFVCPADRFFYPPKPSFITFINIPLYIRDNSAFYICIGIHCCPEKFYHKVGCSTEPASGTLTGVVG